METKFGWELSKRVSDPYSLVDTSWVPVRDPLVDAEMRPVCGDDGDDEYECVAACGDEDEQAAPGLKV